MDSYLLQSRRWLKIKVFIGFERQLVDVNKEVPYEISSYFSLLDINN